MTMSILYRRNDKRLNRQKLPLKKLKMFLVQEKKLCKKCNFNRLVNTFQLSVSRHPFLHSETHLNLIVFSSLTLLCTPPPVGTPRQMSDPDTPFCRSGKIADKNRHAIPLLLEIYVTFVSTHITQQPLQYYHY